MFNIISGTVTLSAVTADGVRRVLDFAIPGDLVGLAREHFPFSAQAADGVVAWRIKRAQLLEAARRHAGV
ncbi:MAG TPA: cyclic nucleotide-binding domain-containing protein, partial [Beijerinckiaceae bacterium]